MATFTSGLPFQHPGDAALYMEQLRTLPLLSAAEEVALAKQMVEARARLKEVIVGSAFGVQKVCDLQRDLKRGRVGLRDVFEVSGTRISAGDAERLTGALERAAAAGRRHLACGRRQRASRSSRSSGKVFELLRELPFSSSQVDRMARGLEARAPLLDGPPKARRRIRKETGLSPRELRRACLQIREARRALARSRDAMVQGNLRLVISTAFGYRNRGLSLSDLIQEGNVGLLRAVDLFDHRRGVRFSTYAMWWIRQTIFRGLANKSRTIRVPIYMLERHRQLGQAQARLRPQLGREPSPEEAAHMLGVPQRVVDKATRTPVEPCSLDMPVRRDEQGPRLGELIRDTTQPSPAEAVAARDLEERMRRMLSSLSPRQERVLRARFGIGTEARSLGEIGKLLGVSRERVRQIEQKALARLRHPCRRRHLEPLMGRER